MRSEPIETLLARKPGSAIGAFIQRKTWSQWTHGALIDGDHVIEARGIPPLKLFMVLFGLIPNTPELGGVIRRPLSEFIQEYPQHRTVWIDGDIQIARDLVGSCYDVQGLVGILFKRRISCDDKYTCAKLIWVTGWCHFRQSMAYRATMQKVLEFSRDRKWPIYLEQYFKEATPVLTPTEQSENGRYLTVE